MVSTWATGGPQQLRPHHLLRQLRADEVADAEPLPQGKRKEHLMSSRCKAKMKTSRCKAKMKTSRCSKTCPDAQMQGEDESRTSNSVQLMRCRHQVRCRHAAAFLRAGPSPLKMILKGWMRFAAKNEPTSCERIQKDIACVHACVRACMHACMHACMQTTTSRRHRISTLHGGILTPPQPTPTH